jgi:hypothetical protein
MLDMNDVLERIGFDEFKLRGQGRYDFQVASMKLMPFPCTVFGYIIGFVGHSFMKLSRVGALERNFIFIYTNGYGL